MEFPVFIINNNNNNNESLISNGGGQLFLLEAVSFVGWRENDGFYQLSLAGSLCQRYHCEFIKNADFSIFHAHLFQNEEGHH